VQIKSPPAKLKQSNKVSLYGFLDNHLTLEGSAVVAINKDRWQIGLRFLSRNIHSMITHQDRWNVHRAKTMRRYTTHYKTLHFKWLLDYAPDLNPVDQEWSYSKHADLTRLTLDDIKELDQLVSSSIGNSRKHTSWPSFNKQRLGSLKCLELFYCFCNSY